MRTPSTPANPPLKQTLLICVALAVVTLIVFWPVHRFDFINYDDTDYVAKNPRIQEGFTSSAIQWAFTESHSSNWHPVTWLSHMLDWQLFGKNAGGHHMVNVMFHIANSLLLFVLLRRMTQTTWPGAFVAALFALHPLHVESVAWVAERKDVLSTFLWLLTTWHYVRFAQARHALPPRRSALDYSLALLFFALGLMSKPMLVTLPFTLLLLDFWPLRRMAGNNNSREITLPRLKSSIVEKIPFFALIVISSALTFWAQRKGGAVTSLNALSLEGRISNALISYPRYLGKMLWPENLTILYPHPWQWPIWIAIAAALFLIGVTVVAIRNRQKHPYLIVGWLWFLGTLVPVIGLVQVGMQAIADRYAYIPLIGIFIAVTWWAWSVFGEPSKNRTALGVVAAVILIGCTLATAKQLQHWQNSGTLFSRAVTLTKKNFLAHNNLGFYLYENGNVDEAIQHFQSAIQIYPQFEISWRNMGQALDEKHRYAEAVTHYEKALQLNPGHLEVRNRLGNSLSEIGRVDEAIGHYNYVLERQPENVDAHNNLGVALAMKGQLADALVHLEKAVALNPRSASAHSNLGNAYAVQQKVDLAISHYKTALSLNTDDARTHNNLGNALAAKGMLAEAIENYRAAIRMEPVNPEAHLNLGLALARNGARNEAILELEEALRQRPNYPDAQQQLHALRSSN
jgi:tetratricopeptide (TPR) repeat protein